MLSSAGRHYEVNGRLPWINFVVDPPTVSESQTEQF
jgi:hypothetical protein